jgi:prepilin-type N-terminal cleavage/methylation domain-containing protein/prepilin-type processing-associated H-X9-DG protein
MAKRKGFTLIELLIVIAIIAVLITILAPALQSAKEHGTQAVCLSNQMALSKGYFIYSDANRSFIPVGYCTARNFTTYLNEKYNLRVPFHPLWTNPPHEEDRTYVGQKGNMDCSLEDRQRGITTGAIYPFVNNMQAYHCPGDRRLYEGTSEGSTPAFFAYRSYNLPDVLFGAVNDLPYAYDGGKSVHLEDTVKKLSVVPFPEEKLCFVEDEYDLSGANYSYDGWSFIPERGRERWWDPVGTFHADGCTVSFLDGHASKYKWKDERSVEYFEDRDSYSNHQPGNVDIEWFLYHYPIGKFYSPQNPF